MEIPNDIIEGWELGNPDPGEFELHVIEAPDYCRDCQYFGRCECLPGESRRRLVPRNGRVVFLARDDNGGESFHYYALVQGSAVRFLLVHKRCYCWDTAMYVTYEQVPGYALSRLTDHRALSEMGES